MYVSVQTHFSKWFNFMFGKELNVLFSLYKKMTNKPQYTIKFIYQIHTR